MTRADRLDQFAIQRGLVAYALRASLMLIAAAWSYQAPRATLREKPGITGDTRFTAKQPATGHCGRDGHPVVRVHHRITRTFLNKQIYRALMTSIPYWGIIALPLTMVVIAGEIDLSFPSTMAVGMVAFFEVYTRRQPGLGLRGRLVAGFLVGLLNGLIIVKIGHSVVDRDHWHAVLLARRGRSHPRGTGRVDDLHPGHRHA